MIYTTDKLQGKKDAEGNYARVILASKNLTFLSKTSISNLEQVLKRTNTEYRYDKKNNIITVGTVDIFLIPLENPEVIYGYSCFEENTKIVTEYGELKIKDVKEGMRVWTTKGWKKVKHVFNNGKRDCIKVIVGNKEILCTPEHRFIDYFDCEIRAKDLTKTTSLVKLDTKRWQKWLSMNGKTEKNLKLLTSMVSDTIDTLIQNLMVKDVIIPAPMEIKRKVIQLCTEIYGNMSIMLRFQRAMTYTIKTEITLTTILKTLNLLQEETMLKSTGKCNQKKNASRLLKLLKKLRKEIQNFSKTLITEKLCQKEQKRLLQNEVSHAHVLSVRDSLFLMLRTLNTVARNVRCLVQTDLQQKDEKLTMKKDNVLSVEKISCVTDITKLHKLVHLTAKTSSVVGQYTVYDLEVEDVHEYFAEGVRVHNCVASFLDELSELPPEICMEAIKAVNERTRQTVKDFRDPFIVSVSSSQGLDGQYMAMEHFKRNGISYVYIRGETRDNIYLKKADIDNLYKIYNETERKVYLEGYFLSVKTSLVFSDYDPAKNMLAVDLFDCLQPDDTVYIGQDFNCIEGNVLIDTIKGKVRMKDLKEGDYVLTRKGYKKVLRKVCKGSKMVQEFNRGLVATPDHVAITPEGEVELSRAQKFYCLKKQSTKHLRALRKMLQFIFKLKKLKFKICKIPLQYVEDLLQEQVQLHIAQNTEIIGKDLAIKERGIQKVYDIEVEDCHEFYANGILVHNCFGNSAVACVVKKGAVIVVKDYDIPDIRRAPEIFRYDFPTQKIVWVPDATATSFYTQFKKELRAKKLKIAYRKSNPLVQDRVFVINKLMYAERMFICPIAKSVEHSLLTHQFDPKTGQPMKGGKGAPDHISDAMGYAVYHIMCWVKDMKDLYDVTLGRSKISRIGSLGQEVDADYRLLSPEKLKLEIPDNVDNLAKE